MKNFARIGLLNPSGAIRSILVEHGNEDIVETKNMLDEYQAYTDGVQMLKRLISAGDIFSIWEEDWSTEKTTNLWKYDVLEPKQKALTHKNIKKLCEYALKQKVEYILIVDLEEAISFTWYHQDDMSLIVEDKWELRLGENHFISETFCLRCGRNYLYEDYLKDPHGEHIWIEKGSCTNCGLDISEDYLGD